MKITFLGQGLEAISDNAVGYHLIEYLRRPDFHSFLAISAFASPAGIWGLSNHIKFAKQNFEKLTLIVGVDQQGTSKEALNEILNLEIDSYIFYQKESPIFHPKIYLFEGTDQTKLIIGSSNLTGSGLFRNVEGSLLIEFDNQDKAGETLLVGFKSYYKALLDFSDPNIFKIDKSIIIDFEAEGIVPDEITRKRNFSKKDTEDSITSFLSAVKIPKRETARIPSIFPTKTIKLISNKPIDNLIPLNQTISTDAITDEDLLWESNPLTARDLNVPEGGNTHATGSMLFNKGKTAGIDQRHYFRDNVFLSLPWVRDNSPSRAHLERATAFFYIYIDGIYQDVFPLMITHNTRTDTPTYIQNNSMTSISWGDAKKVISNKTLIGKTIRLYGHLNEIYILNID